jgi:hypothetical protein
MPGGRVWIATPRFWILDFGFWIVRSVIAHFRRRDVIRRESKIQNLKSKIGKLVANTSLGGYDWLIKEEYEP